MPQSMSTLDLVKMQTNPLTKTAMCKSIAKATLDLLIMGNGK